MAARTESHDRASGGSTNTACPPNEPLITTEEIEEKPWKYIGYRGYSEFISSENDFYILRGFKSLNTRIALAQQDQIAVLEERLKALNIEYGRRDAEDRHNGSFRSDRDDRTELVDLISEKLSLYNNLLIQQSALRKYPPVYRQDLKSVRNWHYNHDHTAIAAEEADYLNHDQDLIPIVPKEKTPLRRFLERSRKFRIFRFWQQQLNPLPVYDQEHLMYMSDKRIDAFISVIIIGIGSIMLIAPMWILNTLQNPVHKLAVITAFIVVFLGFLSSTTAAKPFESLAAVAAYSAVLMVFLQLGASNPP